MSENDRILASADIADRIDDVDQIDRLAASYVIVVIDRRVAGEMRPISGILNSVLLDEKIELDVKIQLTDALDVLQTTGTQRIVGFELHHGERIVPVNKGTMMIVAARLQDIEPKTQMCSLAMQLAPERR